MTIIEAAARIIDPEAFMPHWEPHSDLDVTRKNYLQSKATVKAEAILKLALHTSDLREQLIRNEITVWRSLGVPMDDPALTDAVKNKY